MKEISKQYAQAIFEIACEEGREGEIMAALESAKAVFEQNPEYMELVCSPSIPLSERTAALCEGFAGTLPECVVSLLGLMCEKGRLRAFSSCVDEYKRLLDVRRSVVTARVVSAVALNEDEKHALVQKLEQKSGSTVLLSCEVDPSIMGGVIVEMEGMIMDGSLRAKLREVKEVMKG